MSLNQTSREHIQELIFQRVILMKWSVWESQQCLENFFFPEEKKLLWLM